MKIAMIENETGKEMVIDKRQFLRCPAVATYYHPLEMLETTRGRTDKWMLTYSYRFRLLED